MRLLLRTAAVVTAVFVGLTASARWPTDSRGLLVATACGLLLLGAALLALLRPKPRRRDLLGLWWVPYATAAVSITFTILLWRSIVSYQLTNLERTVRSATWSVQFELASEIHLLAAGLRVLAARPADPQVWRAEAKILAQSFPGVLALEWIDSRYRVRDVIFPGGVRISPPFDRSQIKQLKVIRRRSEAVVVTPIFHLPDGRDALRLAVPRDSRAPTGDLVSAVIAIEQLASAKLAGDVPRFHLELRSNEAVLYRRGDPEQLRSSPWRDETIVRLPGGGAWTLTTAPTSELVTSLRTSLAELVLIAGLLLAFLLALTLDMARARAERTRQLSREIEQRTRAEAALRTLADQLEARVKERTMELETVNAAVRLENALRLNVQQSLSRSNKDLERFAEFISHELRQPLSTIGIWSDLLESRSPAMLDEKGRHYVSKIRASVQRMARLIEGELTLSRVTRLQAARERVEVDRLAREVVAELAPRLREAGATAEIGELPVILADPEQMRQVLRNLVENSLKYGRSGVPLVIRIDGALRARTDGGEQECEIRVHDNGKGFAPADAEDIFAMFRRVHDTPAEGSGIGLAVCRRIIESHGGTISATGRPGDGATFVIVLPAERCEGEGATGPDRGESVDRQ